MPDVRRITKASMHTRRHQVPDRNLRSIHKQSTNSTKLGMRSEHLSLTYEQPHSHRRHGVTLTGTEATVQHLCTPQTQNGFAITIDHPIEYSIHV